VTSSAQPGSYAPGTIHDVKGKRIAITSGLLAACMGVMVVRKTTNRGVR